MAQRKGDIVVPDRNSLIAEQIEYYRACATEYDQWWLHLGHRNLENSFGRRWTAELDRLLDAINDFRPPGRVLEIAGGTGNFTRLLAGQPSSLTVVDSSPEALEVSKKKLGPAAAGIDYVICDVFEWSPPQTYDAIFFSFWLSHVPTDAFGRFWSMIRSALAPGGRVLFLDNLVPLGAAANEIRRETGTTAELEVPYTADIADEDVSIRELSDGRRFRIVKRFWTVDGLAAELRALGWDTRIETTGQAFVWGTAMPQRG
jgi:SAM-dependent methyltransferase